MNLSSCGYLLLFTDMSLKCEHGSHGVSNWMVVPTSINLYECMYESSHCEICCCLYINCSVYKHLNT